MCVWMLFSNFNIYFMFVSIVSNCIFILVSCTIWERTEIKKAELSVFDISSAIISKVELMPQSMDHFYVGIFISTILAVLPALFRFCNSVAEPKTSTETQFVALDISDLLFTQLSSISGLIIERALGSALWYII